MITVLLLEGGGALGCSVQACLRMSKFPYRIISGDIDSEFPGVYRGDVNYILPKSWPEYEEKVREIIKKEKVDIIIPCHDISISHLSKVDYEIPTIVDPKMVKLARSKYDTSQWLKQNGFPYAETWKTIKEVSEFPVVIKPNKGWASQGTRIANNKKELEIFYHLSVKAGGKPIIQKYLDGPEFTNMVFISKEGEILSTTVSRVTKRNGISVKITTIEEGPINEEIRKIAEKLKVIGPVNMQGILTLKGFKIFEFNARFSMTQPVRAYSGVNGPDLLVRNWLYGTKEYPKVKRTTKAFLTRNYLYLDREKWEKLQKKRRFTKEGELKEWL